MPMMKVSDGDWLQILVYSKPLFARVKGGLLVFCASTFIWQFEQVDGSGQSHWLPFNQNVQMVFERAFNNGETECLIADDEGTSCLDLRRRIVSNIFVSDTSHVWFRGSTDSRRVRRCGDSSTTSALIEDDVPFWPICELLDLTVADSAGGPQWKAEIQLTADKLKITRKGQPDELHIRTSSIGSCTKNNGGPVRGYEITLELISRRRITLHFDSKTVRDEFFTVAQIIKTKQRLGALFLPLTLKFPWDRKTDKDSRVHVETVFVAEEARTRVIGPPKPIGDKSCDVFLWVRAVQPTGLTISAIAHRKDMVQCSIQIDDRLGATEIQEMLVLEDSILLVHVCLPEVATSSNPRRVKFQITLNAASMLKQAEVQCLWRVVPNRTQRMDAVPSACEVIIELPPRPKHSITSGDRASRVLFVRY